MGLFTAFHVLISLIAIASGLVVMAGFVGSKKFGGWTAVFLIMTVATSVTGFLFPFHGFTPAIGVGVFSMIILVVALFARYVKRLTGSWRWIFVVTAQLALYLNVAVLVIQLFQKVPALKTIAPTQTESPFLVTQLVLLILFLLITLVGVARFRPVPSNRVRLA